MTSLCQKWSVADKIEINLMILSRLEVWKPMKSKCFNAITCSDLINGRNTFCSMTVSWPKMTCQFLSILMGIFLEMRSRVKSVRYFSPSTRFLESLTWRIHWQLLQRCMRERLWCCGQYETVDHYLYVRFSVAAYAFLFATNRLYLFYPPKTSIK